jgi:ABC-type phosphate transport system substrate-binding protein
MTPEELAAIEKLRKNYNSIHDKLDELLEACGNDPILKRQVGDSMQEALRSYIVAQNRILNKKAADIKRVSKAADKAQEEIDKALEDLKNIKVVLGAITKAVKTIGIIIGALG